MRESKEWYVVDHQGGKLGPFSPLEIFGRILCGSGQLLDQIWKPGMSIPQTMVIPELAEDLKILIPPVSDQIEKSRNHAPEFSNALNSRPDDKGVVSTMQVGMTTLGGAAVGSLIMGALAEAAAPSQEGAFTALDVNGDGSIDGLVVAGDLDNDGILDAIMAVEDINGDGLVDTTMIAEDINGDGLMDVLAIGEDINGDGVIDAIAIAADVDGDGIMDATVILGDINFDGVIDIDPVMGELDLTEAGDSLLDKLGELFSS